MANSLWMFGAGEKTSAGCHIVDSSVEDIGHSYMGSDGDVRWINSVILAVRSSGACTFVAPKKEISREVLF